MTISIEQYKNKAEQAEQARIELEQKIEEKTGHTCTAYIEKYPFQEEITYKILCFSADGLVAISQLFTNKPFYQEEISKVFPDSEPRHTVSCHVKKHGASLVILASLSKRQYREWLGAIRNE